jgi:uncharacterized protein
VIIEQTFTISAPRDRVAAFLLAPEQMLFCVPGVEEVRATESGSYEATLKAKVGPIRATFVGEVTLDGAGSPDVIVANGEGRDRSTGSVAKVALEARLAETGPEVTTITSRADVALRGRLGQFGTGVIQSIAGEMIGQFAKCVESRAMGNGDGDDFPQEVSTPSLTSIAMRGMARGAADKLKGARRRGEQS